MALFKSEWIAENSNGTLTASSIGSGDIVSLSCNYQQNFGIVNCWQKEEGESESCGKCSSNTNGITYTEEIQGTISSFLVRYQPNHGVVNYGVLIEGRESWVSSNENGVKLSYPIPEKQTYVGFQARYQNDFGIVNMRVWTIST